MIDNIYLTMSNIYYTFDKMKEGNLLHPVSVNQVIFFLYKKIFMIMTFKSN